MSSGDKLLHPRAPVVEASGDILVGTAGRSASILRIDRGSGSQSIIASGPFKTVAGLALEGDGSILVADNGSGAPGDGFIARIGRDGFVKVLVSAQTSGWKFLNGRGIAVVPDR